MAACRTARCHGGDAQPRLALPGSRPRITKSKNRYPRLFPGASKRRRRPTSTSCQRDRPPPRDGWPSTSASARAAVQVAHSPAAPVDDCPLGPLVGIAQLDAGAPAAAVRPDPIPPQTVASQHDPGPRVRTQGSGPERAHLPCHGWVTMRSTGPSGRILITRWIRRRRRAPCFGGGNPTCPRCV